MSGGDATKAEEEAEDGDTSEDPVLSNNKENVPQVWALDANDQVIVLGCANGKIEVWESRTGKFKGLYKDDTGVGITHLKLIRSKLVLARLAGYIEFLEVLPSGGDGGGHQDSSSVSADDGDGGSGAINGGVGGGSSSRSLHQSSSSARRCKFLPNNTELDLRNKCPPFFRIHIKLGIFLLLRLRFLHHYHYLSFSPQVHFRKPSSSCSIMGNGTVNNLASSSLGGGSALDGCSAGDEVIRWQQAILAHQEPINTLETGGGFLLTGSQVTISHQQRSCESP